MHNSVQPLGVKEQLTYSFVESWLHMYSDLLIEPKKGRKPEYMEKNPCQVPENDFYCYLKI